MAHWQFDAGLIADLDHAARFGVRRRVPDVLPSGSLTMDAALGVGGLPRASMVELYGPPGVGKSTLSLQMIGAVQRSGSTAALIDTEHSFDAGYATRAGVAIEGLVFSQPGDGDQALRIVEKLAESRVVDLIVVDSLAALVTPEEREGPVGSAQPWGQSEMIADGLRRIARVLANSPACVLFLNQLRSGREPEDGERSCGGYALKLRAAIRVCLEEARPSPVGKRLRLRVTRNQLARPCEVEFEFAEGVGVAPLADLMERGLETGVIVRSGAGYFFGEEFLGRGREKLAMWLSDQPRLACTLREVVAKALRNRLPS